MQVAPEIAFRDVEATDRIKSRILDKIEGLEEVHDGLIACRVMAEASDAPNQYRVRLDVTVPGGEIIVNRDPPSDEAARDLRTAVDRAFDRARRQLRELKRKQRGDVKEHELPPHGQIVKLATTETGDRYGFLMSRDGRQIYFHENALVDLDYDELETGLEVRFAEEEGAEGPQASTVAELDPQQVGPRQEEEIPLTDRTGR